MDKLIIPEPFSGGILLSYKCNSECQHCMYACSAKWSEDWISIRDLTDVLSQLAALIKPKYPSGFERIGINYGLHLTGGEPFLNYPLLVEATRIADTFGIPSLFVETNCFWCINDRDVLEKLKQLKEVGLHSILISVNPFILEYVPFERTERAIRISKEVFGNNIMVYQEFFYNQFKALHLQNTLSFEDYYKKVGPDCLRYVEMFPMGRASYRLDNFYRRYSADKFFGTSCREELTRDWHIHVDNYCNYMAGYCGGISLGNAKQLNTFCDEGIILDDHLILKFLISDIKELFTFAVNHFKYQELSKGYTSKCHLCVDIRRHLVKHSNEFRELQPREFYNHLR